MLVGRWLRLKDLKISNIFGAPNPKPEPQFTLLNQQQKYDKEFWPNFDLNFNDKIRHQYNFNNGPITTDSSRLNFNHQIIDNDFEKNRQNRNLNNKEKYSNEYKHLYPKYIKGEVIVHRPPPILVNREPTNLLIKHSPVLINPAPVVIHRSPQPVRPIIIHKPKLQPSSPALKIQPVFVNVNRKKPSIPKPHYISDHSDLDDDWLKHYLHNKDKRSFIGNHKEIEDTRQHHSPQHYLNESEDEILSTLQSRNKNTYLNKSVNLKNQFNTNLRNSYIYDK